MAVGFWLTVMLDFYTQGLVSAETAATINRRSTQTPEALEAEAKVTETRSSPGSSTPTGRWRRRLGHEDSSIGGHSESF